MSPAGGYEYQPFLAELYDLVPIYAERRDLEFYLQSCRDAAGKILEIGCGTGRILLPVARVGGRVMGLDISQHMLVRCEKKLQLESREVQDRVELVCASMTNFRLEEAFALAIVPFRPLQHLLTVDAQLACLRSINAHLVMGGKLVFDVFQVDLGRILDPRYRKEMEDMPETELPDGRKLRRTNRIAAVHRAEQTTDVEIIFYLTGTDGKTERLVQAFPFRYFSRYEVEHLLARCGFKVLALFGNFDQSPLSDDSPEMIFVAEKDQELATGC
ncbi:MAG: class I SAM-dependent methyltransferase [bacterium]|nr:class I SAM-dependent methyltransferase [bacterium]